VLPQVSAVSWHMWRVLAALARWIRGEVWAPVAQAGDRGGPACRYRVLRTP